MSEVEESLKRILKNRVREEVLDEMVREIIKCFLGDVKVGMIVFVETKVDVREAKQTDDRFQKIYM